MRLGNETSLLLPTCDLEFLWLSGADAAEDEEVDVTSVDPIAAFCSR